MMTSVLKSVSETAMGVCSKRLELFLLKVQRCFCKYWYVCTTRM